MAGEKARGARSPGGFRTGLARIIEGARRHGQLLALLYLGLDGVSTVVEGFGSEAGEGLLAEVETRVRKVIRASDWVGQGATPSAKVGGHEFTILLAEIDSAHDAAQVARRILEELNRPFEIRGMPLAATGSVGIALFPHDGIDLDSLWVNAIAAWSRARETDDSSYRFCSSAMNEAHAEQLEIASELRQAIDEHELLIYYQPVFDAVGGHLTAAEALVRWQHPSRGLLAPEEFVAVAEETGLIDVIGEYVLRVACTQARDWADSKGARLRMSVNLSREQLRPGRLAELVEGALESTGLAADQLELGLSERLLHRADDPEPTLLGKLSHLGVGLTLDDFGLGYSALAHLRRFAIDRIRIHHSFIEGLPDDHDDQALISGLLALARCMKLRSVATGVETEEQMEFLKKHGCDELQGYLFGEPVSAEAFEKEYLA